MRIIFLSLVMLLFGCSSSVEDSEGNEFSKQSNKELEVLKKEFVMKEEVEINFSSASTEDRFILELIGESPSKSMASFVILSNENDTLYSENFESRALIGYKLIELKEPTIADRDSVVIASVNSFFNSDNYTTPAIDKNEGYDSDYNFVVEKNIWGDIKSNSTSKSFYYKLWEGGQKWIAYSPILKKIVVISVCC